MTPGLRTSDLLPAFGSLVELVDLRHQLADATSDRLRELLWERGLLLFRGQDLDPDDQARLVGLFGTVAPMGSEGRMYSILTNVGSAQATGESRLPFHSDLTYTPAPYDIISLAGMEVEGPAAPTRFASTAAGYAALPDGLKARIDGLTNVHVHFHFDGLDFVKTDLRALPEQAEYATADDFPRQSWPVVVRHRKTGVPTLFVSQWFSHIEGLGEDESDRLLEDLFGYLYRPANVYEHEWSVGDVIVWDNLAIQHERPAFHEQGAVRSLRKVIAVPGGRTLQELYELAGAAMPSSYGRGT